MDHKTCRENLSAYLDGELPREEKVSLEEHLSGCADCAKVLAELKSLSLIIQKHAEPVPLSLKARVFGGQPEKTAPYGWLKPLLAASMAAAGVLITLNLMKTPESERAPLPGLNMYAESLQAPKAGSSLDMFKENAAKAGGVGDSGFGQSKAARSLTGTFAPAETPAPRTAPVAAVRGGAYAQAKYAGPRSFGAMSAGMAGGKAQADKSGTLKMSLLQQGPVEFRGPVCVYVSSARSRKAASERMGEEEKDDFFWYLGKALIFLEKSGTPSPSAEPGNLVFVKKDGSRKTVTAKDCDLGFIFFDGIQDPLVVTDFITITDRYNKYFGTSLQPIGDEIPE